MVVLATLDRHEKRLAALNAGIADADLARAVEADQRAISRPWARARAGLVRARRREARVAPMFSRFRASARSIRSAHRSRTPRRAAHAFVFTSAGDGAPPPESDPAEQTAPRDGRAARGAPC